MLRRVALAIGAVGLCSAPLTAQSPASQSAMRLESAGPWVDSVFGRFVTARTPGCAVGLTRDGSLALTRTYGLAAVDRRANHRARIAPTYQRTARLLHPPRCRRMAGGRDAHRGAVSRSHLASENSQFPAGRRIPVQQHRVCPAVDHRSARVGTFAA